MAEAYKLVDYTQFIDGVADSARDVTLSRARGLAQCKRKLDTFIETVYKPERVPGDARLKQLKKMLDSFGAVRSESQKMFHKHFLAASLPHIYGSEDFERHQVRKKEMGAPPPDPRACGGLRQSAARG
jgi:hypothetical protein